jgi:hypothetical protein
MLWRNKGWGHSVGASGWSGSRYHECARTGGQVHFLRFLYRLAGICERALDTASAQLRRAGEASATGSPGQTHTITWSRIVDNHRGVIEGPSATRFYLVAGYSTEQSKSTIKQFAQTMLVQNESQHAA